MEPVKGRRLPDTTWGELPVPLDDFAPGDYWKYLDRKTGEPMHVEESSNLTGMVWGYYSPDGNGMGTLRLHTVREEDDGTMSIRAGDGSSNSVLHTGGAQRTQWHGYVDHGLWTSV